MTTELVYYCEDAAGRIVELIADAETSGRLATRKRDQHRAETTVRALKEALGLVLLERECKKVGQAVPMPDVDKYLKENKRVPVV